MEVALKRGEFYWPVRRGFLFFLWFSFVFFCLEITQTKAAGKPLSPRSSIAPLLLHIENITLYFTRGLEERNIYLSYKETGKTLFTAKRTNPPSHKTSLKSPRAFTLKGSEHAASSTLAGHNIRYTETHFDPVEGAGDCYLLSLLLFFPGLRMQFFNDRSF